MRGLIHEVAEGTGARIVNPMLARLKRACKLHRDDEAEKVRALAREILNDWAAITAFVTNPDLPATNNEAERALRDAVIAGRRPPHRGGLGGLRRHSERLGDLPPPRCRTVALHHRPAGPTCWPGPAKVCRTPPSRFQHDGGRETGPQRLLIQRPPRLVHRPEPLVGHGVRRNR